MTREEMDAKLEAVEARTEAKIAEVNASIQRLADAIIGDRGLISEVRELKVSNKESIAQARSEGQFTRWTLFGIALAIIGTFIAVLAFGGDQFGAGKELGSSITNIESKVDALSKNAGSGNVKSLPDKPK